MSHITLSMLAYRLGVHPTNARKIALRYGIKPRRQQIRGLGRHQRLLVWSEDEARQLVELRLRDGYLVGGTDDGHDTAADRAAALDHSGSR